MKQLSGTDAAILYAESPKAPLHISNLAIYDPSTAPGGKVRFKEIIENYSRRVRGVPAMTQHIVEVPLQLDNPYWVDDGTFDPEFHIRHIALPKPGDWRQLCILISRLHSRPLDLSRPLWELWVIEGLDEVDGLPKGCFALFQKIHHAAIDGVSGVQMTQAVHDLTPDYDTDIEQPVSVQIDGNPRKTELLLRSSVNAIKKPLEFVSFARNTVPGLARTIAGVRSGELKRVTDIPDTRFNGPISPYRVWDAATFPLEDVKRIKNSVEGATINDAALALIGGALNKYLAAHNELPDTSMAAVVPLNIRSDKDKMGGNLVSVMTVKLGSDITDPRERLQAVHQNAVNGKELNTAIGARTMTDLTDVLPSLVTSQAMRLSANLGLTNRMDPIVNTAVTNVPGPQVPLYNTGAKLVSFLGAGPIGEGIGLFHAVSSYCESFSISFTACREIMPDPAFYTQCIRDTFEEMLASASPKVTRKRSRKKS